MIQREIWVDKILSHYGREAKISGIEIGCLRADTASYLIRFLPNLHLTSIEISHENDGEIARVTVEYKERFILKHGHSDDIAKEIIEKVDFVLVDGDHSYGQCKNDILNYLPKVKGGGFLGGHDYVISEVKKAVDEILGDKVIIEDDGVWWFNL